jgi:hypothetical protein
MQVHGVEKWFPDLALLKVYKGVATHFTCWHETFGMGFLNWIVQCVDTRVWILCLSEVVG